MFILKENQVILDDEYFVKFHVCFVGIKSRFYKCL